AGGGSLRRLGRGGARRGHGDRRRRSPLGRRGGGGPRSHPVGPDAPRSSRIGLAASGGRGVRLRRPGPARAAGHGRARKDAVSGLDADAGAEPAQDATADDDGEAAEAPAPGSEGPFPGTGIIRASVAGTALFAVIGVLGAIWPDVFGVPFLVV